jgi:protein-tyrosine phosphatase
MNVGNLTHRYSANPVDNANRPHHPTHAAHSLSHNVHSILHAIAAQSQTIALALEKKLDELVFDAKDLIAQMEVNPFCYYGTVGDAIDALTSWNDNGIHWLPGDVEAEKNGIENFAEVRSGIYRGHVPSSLVSFQWMHDTKHIGTEIDLRQEWEKPATSAWAAAADVDHISIPIPDVGTPDGPQINQLFSILDAAKERQDHDPEGAHGIFIHCKAGANRTGTMVALASIRLGMSADQAVAVAESRGMFPITYQPVTQKAAIDEINFILKYGDAYHALNIRPSSPEEQKFNAFFCDYIEQHKNVSRRDFAGEVIAAWPY